MLAADKDCIFLMGEMIHSVLGDDLNDRRSKHLMPDCINDLAAARRFLGFSLSFLPSKPCAAAPILPSQSRPTSGNAFAVVDALCHHNAEAGLTGIQISVTNFSVSLVMT